MLKIYRVTWALSAVRVKVFKQQVSGVDDDAVKLCHGCELGVRKHRGVSRVEKVTEAQVSFRSQDRQREDVRVVAIPCLHNAVIEPPSYDRRFSQQLVPVFWRAKIVCDCDDDVA
jgi:hypothetical protein